MIRTETTPAALLRMPRAPRWVTAALVLMAGAAGLVSTSTSAADADEVGTAATCDGVWVVVDAREVGGSITTRCAPGDPDSGLAALRAAGHTYEFVPRVPGMVCTIDGRPDPCNGAPADAYWSYWHAEEGGTWTYASRGAGERDPQPGEVEGWAFGAGDPPGTSPPEPAGEDADDGSSGNDSPDDGSSDDGGDGSGSGSSDDGSSDSESPGSDSSGSDPDAETAEAHDDGSTSSASTSSTAAAGGGSPGADGATSTDDTDDTDDGSEASEPGASDGETTTGDADAEAQPPDASDGDADDGRGSDETRGNRGPAGERGDVVALDHPGDGGAGTWTGLALGAGLAGALAAGAAWQVRRRRLEA